MCSALMQVLRSVCLPAQVIVTYGTRCLHMGPSSDPYGTKYKGTWICLQILARALSGNYVNFGVFELYGDPALKVKPGRWTQWNASLMARRNTGSSRWDRMAGRKAARQAGGRAGRRTDERTDRQTDKQTGPVRLQRVCPLRPI
jgi:hypothetical protein